MLIFFNKFCFSKYHDTHVFDFPQLVIIEKAARQSISLLLPLEAGKTKATTKKNKKTNAKKTIQKL